MSGHRDAGFDALMLPFLDDVFEFARHLTGNVPAAEELAQDAFARAFEAFHRFLPGTSPRAWLFTIARNLHFNDQRGQRRHPTVSLEEHHEADAVVEEARDDRTPELDQAIARLPVKLREVVVLDLQGLTCREIGGVVNCPAGTVMSRLHRARQLLRGLLEVEVHARRGQG